MLSKKNLYRFPWSLNDNPIGWLEVTDKCNIYCRGCYRMNGLAGHKSLAQIKEEIDLLARWRNCDNISLAGGEPLIHPEIMEIVSYIHERGMKPLILTNGVKLENNRPMVEELKRAGAIGFTFHIDSEQQRPHYKGKTEQELLDLRLQYARMVADVGGLFVSFGMTVYPGNVDFVPKMVQWANEHIDIVHGLVFITFRNATMDQAFDYYANGRQVSPQVTYVTETGTVADIASTDVYDKIKAHFDHYEASAYLGGTQTEGKITWLVSAQLGSKHKMYGSVGTKVMELLQVFHHMWYGTYLVYSPSNKLPKVAFLLSALDKGIRRAHGQFWRDLIRHPQRAFQPIYVQSIGIIQAPDLLPDGRIDMCESCPDMTVWDGKLVHSCRMDEWRLYGGYVTPQPRVTDVTGGSTGVIQPDAIPVKEATPAK